MAKPSMYVIETKDDLDHSHQIYIDDIRRDTIALIAFFLEDAGREYDVWTIGNPPTRMIPSDFRFWNGSFKFWRQS